MNSYPTRSQTTQTGSAVSLNNYQFDFGTPSNRKSSTVRSLNDQKHPHQTTPHSFSPSPSSSSASWAPNKSSWTHQPSPTPAPASRSALSKPTSMVGDISGKSWASTAPSGPGSRLGLSESNPNLFGDLLGSALGQAKPASNVPLKEAVSRNSNLADSLPNLNNPMKNSRWGSAGNAGNYSNMVGSSAKRGNFLGFGMNSGAPMNSKKDPFASLADFGSKASSPLGNSSANRNTSSGDCSFGAKIGASNPSPMSSNSNASNLDNSTKIGDLGVPKNQDFSPQMQKNREPEGVDPLEILFSPAAAAAASGSAANEAFSEVEDWGMDSEFGGNDAGSTIELEGLPPPPAGVTASMAKNKGMDNQRQGQYADAIKWLSWAVAILEKGGDGGAGIVGEVLSCRASCYKEVGEYKKAVADCSKVLEHDSRNVSVLLQRALLYESSEKYKFGAEDLRTVLKIDPSNRLAKSTIHRLAKMAD